MSHFEPSEIRELIQIIEAVETLIALTGNKDLAVTIFFTAIKALLNLSMIDSTQLEKCAVEWLAKGQISKHQQETIKQLLAGK